MRLGVLSDTHDRLHPLVWELFDGVDTILHAGDICDDRILDDLQALAPVVAVSGNMDGSPTARRPLTFSGEIGGIRVCMTHGHLLDARDYFSSALGLFAKDRPRLIVLGHSHQPRIETRREVTCLNPGSAGPPRLGHAPTVAIVSIGPDGTLTCAHFPLRAGPHP